MLQVTKPCQIILQRMLSETALYVAELPHIMLILFPGRSPPWYPV